MYMKNISRSILTTKEVTQAFIIGLEPLEKDAKVRPNRVTVKSDVQR
jgi:hypothetical protein